MGDLLGIMFNAMDGSPATLTIWRWTSGKQLLRLETPRPALWFSFLSETTFVVPCMDRDDVMTATLHIYRIPDEVLDPANDTQHTDSSPVILNPLPEAGYLLPPFNDKSITGYSLVCRSHPLPSPRAYVPPRPTSADPNCDDLKAPAQPASAEPPVPDPPTFQVDPDERIMTFSFIFNVYYDDPMGHGIIAWQESHVLATHISTLLSHTKLPLEEIPPLPLDALVDLEALPFSLEPVTPPIIVPWSAWADRARWLGDRTRRNWYSHTYGHRFVRPTWRQSEDHNDPFSIQVIDFNPYNIRRQAQREREFEAWRKQQHPTAPEEADKEALTSTALDSDIPPGASSIETSTGAINLALRLDQPLPEPQPSRPRVISEPSVIQGHVFTEPVKTSLPYMEVTSSEILYDFEGLMICEEHVLRLKRRSTSTSEIVLEIYSI
ncbi:hypothetical protein M407DRAFT_195785 [Tulasnella calospora MUT 4182]|uniref:Uncharacterized protein n=1 Tax=Tulasnella calospora MUT 4182 TaxID=1051891 RepID=A0A0C3QKK4_9AGAM|nr:hypothetical protein M407DRAFT_195785 [Tulasnella calospora MUT 4182]